jgi:diketogulonate reductase-like aldo/keto reductase
MRQRNSYSRIIQELEEWQHLSKGTKIRLFQHCIENDITSFHINYLNSGSYNEELGTALSESQLSRDEIQLIARLSCKKVEPDAFTSEVEEILELLKTDYLDLILLEGKDFSEATVSLLQRLKAQGKIMELGFSGSEEDMQQHWNLPLSCSAKLTNLRLEPQSMEKLSRIGAEKREITEMIFLEPRETENEWIRLNDLGAKYNLHPSEFLFAWVLEHPAHFHPIIKGKEEATIDTAVKAFHTSLIKEDWWKLVQNN